MTYKTSILIAHLVSGLLAVTAASPASAQTAQITYRAAELRSSEGTQAVYDRITASARKACNQGVYHSTNKRCRRDLVGMLVGKIANPTMVALHEGKPTQLASR